MCTPATHHAQAVRWGRLLVRVRGRVRVGVGGEVRVRARVIRAGVRG